MRWFIAKVLFIIGFRKRTKNGYITLFNWQEKWLG